MGHERQRSPHAAARHPSLPASWHEDVARLIATLGDPALPLQLDAMLRRLAPFDLSATFGFIEGADRPLLLHDGYGQWAAPAALAAYLAGAYLLDPFYTACVQRRPDGLYRMRELSPDAFFESEFYHSSQVHPCVSAEPGSLVEEIGYVAELAPGFRAAYSLMRVRGRLPFNEDEMELLRSVEPVIRQAMIAQWRHLASVAPSAPARGHGLEDAFARFERGRLTPRQQIIVQLVLRGHSSASVAEQTGLSEGTVKIHRKNIYRRLGISSQTELFNLFVRHLLADLHHS
jgi:DNA-binding CsgD family transcriptional regulator